MSQVCCWTGRLVKDVDFRYSEKGTAFCFVKMAVSRGYYPKEGSEAKVDFLEFKAFGDHAQVLADGIKGQLIEIHGHAENYSRERTDGSKEYGIQLVVDLSINHSKKREQKPDEAPAE